MNTHGPTNARLSEVWIDTGTDGAGTPILRKVAMRFRPALIARAMSERLNRRLEIDETERPTQIEIDATAMHTATRASRGRAVKPGDRLTIARRHAGRSPKDVTYEHFEIVSMDDAGDQRPGGIQRLTIGLKAAIAPVGSLAAKAGGGNSGGSS